MSDLVPQAAIDAATYALGLAPQGSEKLPYVLNAAAPHIAAYALRVARDEIDKRNPPAGEGDWVATAMAALDDLANEIEANAAFTDMVQLGQEIGGE